MFWLLALFAPFVALIPSRLPWIPGWQGPMYFIAMGVVLGGVVAAGANAVRELRAHPKEGQIGAVLRSVSVLTVAIVGGFMALIDFAPPRFVRAIDVAGTTVYIYDARFLDPMVAVRVRRGTWPLERDLVAVPMCEPRDVRLEGTTLHVCHRTCDLVTGTCLSSAAATPR
jgi:hypothetical protein